MKPNLRLVESLINRPSGAAALHLPSIQALVPNNKGLLKRTEKQKSSYGMLILVIVAHVAGLAWLLGHQPAPPKIKEPLPLIMVSLVASPAPEPEIVPLVPVPPQPVVKKQTPVVKPLKITPKPVATKTEVAQPAATEAPPTPAAPVVVAKVPEVVALPPKVEAEPVVEPPRYGVAYLHNPKPDYPKMAERLGQQGRVLLKVLVAENGTAETVALASSSGFERLDQAAIEVVKTWSFIPAKRNNKAISAYVSVPVVFSLDN